MVADIPYAFNAYGFQVAGVVHVREPVEDTYTDGVVVGPASGNYRLDRNTVGVDLYDPTGQVIGITVQLDIYQRFVRARVKTRRPDGGWDETGWVTVNF